MNFYKVTLAYRGTGRHGWQIQRGQNIPTIQGEIHLALEKLISGVQVESIGSGRTDAGVHALKQIARLGLSKEIPPDGLLKGLNSLLPSDIRLLACERSDQNFNPVFDATLKEYWYAFTFNNINPFNADLLASFNMFDLKRLEEAMGQFIGQHDFKNFQCVGTQVKSTVREIYSLELQAISRESALPLLENYYLIKVKGNGFLKQMVRLIVGALVAYAQSKISLEDLAKAIRGDTIQRNWSVVPAQGLYLANVSYDLK